ncbi:hypothetical protein ACFYPC_12495 [Streptomyces sp. NPDC005808]|uniref:hypothetical protein n=1 Tax=Streptomyces sp. NPDC005808 TaxID=3364734 RepID=UPI0036877DA2
MAMVGLFWITEDAVYVGAEPVAVSALPAVSGGIHLQVERELSAVVLERLADGGASVGDLLAWRRGQADDSTPRRAESEALLRKWSGE